MMILRSLWTVLRIRATAFQIQWFVPDELTIRILRQWMKEDAAD